MKSTAKTVDEYTNAVPEDRRPAIETVLRMVRANIPKGYNETIDWGMICWQVPLSLYSDTYNKKPFMYVALANQKNYMALYILAPYTAPNVVDKFKAEYKATGKKLDMGRGCVRFKKLEDLPLEVIGKYIAKTTPEELAAYAKAMHSPK